MSCGKGVPKDPVWGFYNITGEGKDKIAKCKECDSAVSAESDLRMKCPKQVHGQVNWEATVLSAPLCQLTVPDESVSSPVKKKNC